MKRTQVPYPLVAAALLAACASALQAQQPTRTPAIPAENLRRYLSVFAADSMQGREMGSAGDVKATDYLAAQLRRIGVPPAGDSGTYFQTLPLFRRALDSAATAIAVGDTPLVLSQDYLPLPAFGTFLPFGMQGSLDGVQVVYGGAMGDTAPTLTAEQAAGKLVVFGPPQGPLGPEAGLGAAVRRYAAAAGLAFAVLDFVPPEQRGFIQNPPPAMGGELPAGPLGLLIGFQVVGTLFEVPLDSLTPGTPGRTIRGSVRFTVTPVELPARNVVAVVGGSDPALRNQYVVIGAHSDHTGLRDRALDHDSVWAFNHVVRPDGAESEMRPATAEEQTRIAAIRDSLRALHSPLADSIYNGADDDGSGSITLLGIAEALTRSATKPKRSILLVWHTGEEGGLFGSQWFTDHPTVPRDSIVAELNLDMVGRGSATDIKGGGPGYVQLIGSRRLSTELGDLVETVNARDKHGFTFDYQFDADGHPQNYYCRSDHYMYARYGIPIVFFSTGSHQDYHMLTDEVQYIDFEKMARVGGLVMDLARTVADLDHRVVVDKPKPDPNAPCRQ